VNRATLIDALRSPTATKAVFWFFGTLESSQEGIKASIPRRRGRAYDLVSRETDSPSDGDSARRGRPKGDIEKTLVGHVGQRGMISESPRLDRPLAREIGVVVALTLVGAVVRLWAPGRLGLVHFDEGIYALAGLWSLSPQGLAGIDPTVISYAPAGFPVLVGLSYLVLGVNDLAAILVSVCSGTLTIPMAAWLARRTFGPGAGSAAAAFAALSGPDIAFSRMALTDASFLLFWLAAIGLGQRFLERPNLTRASFLGFAVGVAQLFKYNGWIAGGVTALCAAIWLVFHRDPWRTRSTLATWGWGGFAAIIAAITYWPWFDFVASNGGYLALLAHQRSYLGGLASWPGHWSLQLAQQQFLSGGPAWRAGAGLLACLGMLISDGTMSIERERLPRTLLELAGLTAFALIPGFMWWVALVWIFLATSEKGGTWTKASCTVCTGWVVLSILTPFYHPYARLWLPIDAFGWLLAAGAFVRIRSTAKATGRGDRWPWNIRSVPLPWLTLAAVLCALLPLVSGSKKPSVPLLGPSDSLRHAAQAILFELPPKTKDLRAYARPPLIFYLALADGVTVGRQPDLAHLSRPANLTSWAVLDLALVRQDNLKETDLDRWFRDWVVVREIPTTLNPAALLDIDPAAARSAVIDASAPVRLLRPRRMEEIR
jgi:4-amino-4-deoxy-L-arabinose transferase-like glycosyltransferase